MQLTQSTAFNRMVFMVGSADHITGLAGLTLTITASKDGAAFASITPTQTDRGDGWYNLALTTTHTNTVGQLAFHITSAAADPLDFADDVVATPGGGAPTAAQNATAVWTDLLAGSDFSTALSIGKLLKDDIDALISSRSTYAGGAVASVTGNVGGNVGGNVTGSVGSVLGAVGSVTGVVGSVTGAVGSVAGNVGGNVVGSVGSVVGAVGSVTGNVGGITGITFPANFSALVIDASGRLRALVGLTQNVAFTTFAFLMTDSAGAPVTGLIDANFTSKLYAIGGGASGTLSGTITEISATNAPGYYQIDFTAAQLNGRVVSLTFEATGTVATKLTIITSV